MPRPLVPASLALLFALPALAQDPAPLTAPTSPGPTSPAPTSPAPATLETLDNTAPQPPTLADIVKQPDWQAAVVAAARAQFSQIPGSCSNPSFKPTGDLTVFQAPSFTTSPVPVGGMWAERVAVAGCGPARALNVLTVAKPGGPPDRIAMLPGTTHTDPLTQRSALQYAQAIASRASPPNCRRQSFIEADFAGYIGLPSAQVRDGRDGRSWVEDWLLYACGSIYGIKMQFTPNGDGTQLVGSNPVRIGGETPANAPAAPPPAAPPARHR